MEPSLPDPSPAKAVGFFSLVPPPVAVYALLSILDLGFSLIAFQLGYPESNPALAFMKEQGLFEFVKISATLLIVLIGVLLWRLQIVRVILGLANVVMFGVFVLHLYSLIRHATIS